MSCQPGWISASGSAHVRPSGWTWPWFSCHTSRQRVPSPRWVVASDHGLSPGSTVMVGAPSAGSAAGASAGADGGVDEEGVEVDDVDASCTTEAGRARAAGDRSRSALTAAAEDDDGAGTDGSATDGACGATVV